MSKKSGKKTSETRKERTLSSPLAVFPLSEAVALGVILISVIAMTISGPGDIMLMAILALVSCVVGCFQRSPHFSVLAVLCLIGISSLGFISNYMHFGVLFYGYASMMLSLAPIYALSRCLGKHASTSMFIGCSLWGAIVAVMSISQTIISTFSGSAVYRLDIFNIGSNSLGLFFVLCWFCILNIKSSTKQHNNNLSGENSNWTSRIVNQLDGGYKLLRLVSIIEPILLIALAMTMSLGSMLSLVTGLLFLVAYKKIIRKISWKTSISTYLPVFARVVIGIATGIFLFLALSSKILILFIAVLVYILALIIFWNALSHYLKEHARVSGVIAAFAIVLSGLVCLLRPNASATLLERFHMWESGLSYLFSEPLLGMGTFTWQGIDSTDGGTFFNTVYIHNGFLHYGVEIGIISLILLVVLTFLSFRQKTLLAQQGAKTAFLIHILMDISLFIPGTIAVFICASSPSDNEQRECDVISSRILFGGLSLCFIFLIAGAI